MPTAPVYAPVRLARHALLALLVPGLLAAQARRPITHEDLFLMKRVGAPLVSPDGRWAAFSVTEPAYTEADQSSDLWLVPTDGSAPPRRITSTRGGEGGLAWSPDGRRLAFTARREGDDASQVYLLDVTGGGEAQRLTTLATGASSPRWRPDGRAILFTSSVYPGAATDSANRAAAAERRARRYNARVYDDFPIRNWDTWLDDRRPHLFVQTLEPAGRARDLLAGTRLAAMPGFGGQLSNGSEGISAAWTADGTGIVFAATTNRNEAAFAEVVQSLWLVREAGGEPERLTDGSSSFGSPLFSPDGTALYATMEPQSEHTYNLSRIVTWAWPARGRPRVLTGDWDRDPSDLEFSPDGRTLYFTAGDAGLVRLYQMPAGGGEVREVGRLDAGAYSGLSAGGARGATVLAAAWQSAVSPAEIVRIDPASGRRTALTRFNEARVAVIDWQPVRHVWFTSSRGRRIHNLMVVPPGFDSTRSYPVFVLIHGGPHSMWTDNLGLRWNPHLLGAPGYVVLMTNYTGSTGFGEQFARNIQFDPLQTPGDELNEAVDTALARFRFLDRERLVAGGASYGGHLANWLAVTTTRYRALISHAGLWDLESQYATSDYTYGRERNVGGPPWENHPLWREQSPMRRAANLRTPVLVSIGERDFRVPLNNALEFWTALQRQRVPSRLIVWPTENHWILNGENSRFFYREVHAWIARWLNAAPAVGGAP